MSPTRQMHGLETGKILAMHEDLRSPNQFGEPPFVSMCVVSDPCISCFHDMDTYSRMPHTLYLLAILLDTASEITQILLSG